MIGNDHYNLSGQQDLNVPVGETQQVRLGDVFILGPGLILLGMKKTKLTAGERFFLITTGIGTVVYNLHNYYQEERRKTYLLHKELGKEPEPMA